MLWVRNNYLLCAVYENLITQLYIVSSAAVTLNDNNWESAWRPENLVFNRRFYCSQW